MGRIFPRDCILGLINKKLYLNNGLKFRIFNKDGFKKFCKENKNINSLSEELYEE